VKDKHIVLISNFYEFILKTAELKDMDLFCEVLLLIGNILFEIGDLNKACFFYNQIRICCEMSHGLVKYK